ncbi:MAG TPA: four helix bundle protein [Cyclobacteriaceae bacterium]|jgi:four helix bundle protein|nr:four helix bundle protein [Cyclobacteriaceae bacterium]
MKSDNVIQGKSFAFAIKIVNTYKLLQSNHEYVLSKQLLKSGTSIGANVEEAIGGQSKADFISKLSIAYKEARETLYWIKLLSATEFLSREVSEDLISDAEEICRIIGKIQITSKNSIRNSVISNS